MKYGSLFTGIGGIDLGLDRAGMECRWQIEIDPFCRQVLEKHWPHVRRYGDITKLDASELEPVDLIAGGFPCQDVSNAGKRIGIDGARSGLWSEMYRIVCKIRPRYVVVENVAGLLVRGVDRVLGDLAASGYDAEWRMFRASDFGLYHRRERIVIVAYAGGAGSALIEQTATRRRSGVGRYAANSGNRSILMADIERAGLEGNERGIVAGEQSNSRHTAGCDSGIARVTGRQDGASPSWLLRGVHGIPDRMDRVRTLGNAVVPQVAEWIGRRIMTVR